MQAAGIGYLDCRQQFGGKGLILRISKNRNPLDHAVSGNRLDKPTPFNHPTRFRDGIRRPRRSNDLFKQPAAVQLQPGRLFRTQRRQNRQGVRLIQRSFGHSDTIRKFSVNRRQKAARFGDRRTPRRSAAADAAALTQPAINQHRFSIDRQIKEVWRGQTAETRNARRAFDPVSRGHPAAFEYGDIGGSEIGIHRNSLHQKGARRACRRAKPAADTAVSLQSDGPKPPAQHTLGAGLTAKAALGAGAADDQAGV